MFPESRLKELTHSHLSKLAGKSPLNEADRKRFAAHLGITAAGIKSIEKIEDVDELKLICTERMEEGELQELAEDDAHHSGTGTARFTMPMSGLNLSFFESACTFKKWLRLGRKLMTFNLITIRGGQYLSLNAILCHVKVLNCILSNFRLHSGTRGLGSSRPKRTVERHKPNGKT